MLDYREARYWTREDAYWVPGTEGHWPAQLLSKLERG